MIQRNQFMHRVAMLGVACVCLACFGCDALQGAAGEPDGTAKTSTKTEDLVAVALALVGSAQLADVLVVDDIATLGQQAAVVAEQVEARAKVKAPCAQISRTDTTVVVDFGSGCAPAGAKLSLSGKVTAAVATGEKDGKKTLELQLTFDAFGVDDKIATGAGTMQAVPGTELWAVAIALNMTSGTAAAVGGVDAQIGKIQVAGGSYNGLTFGTMPDTKVQRDKTEIGVTVTDLLLEKGACYPSNGTIVFNTAGVKTTIAFAATTKDSGIAQLTPPLQKTAKDQELPGVGWKCN